MRLSLLLATIVISAICSAQTSYPPGNPPISSQPGSRPLSAPPPVGSASVTPTPSPANSSDLGAILQRLEQETSGLNTDIGKLRVEKWKVDSATKHQASENIGSIQRNVTAALPGLIATVRTTPQSLAANFKLYRNLNALYDVVASISESAGAFGRREEYDVMAPHASALDEYRRNYGEYLQQMTASADDRIAAAEREKAAAIAAQQQAPPKKIVVDDDEPAPPPKKKKPAKKSAANPSTTGTSAPK